MHPDLSTIVVDARTPKVEALRVLDESAGRILFIVQDDILVGVLTDGDVRRHILGGHDFSGPVSEVMNLDYVSAREGYTEEEVKSLFLATRVHCVPVIDEGGRLVDAVWWADLFDTAKPRFRPIDVPVAIMAGGKGTRLEPFTRILPKPLMPIGENPVLRVIMDRFYEQGCERFLVSLNFKANLIRAYFSEDSFPYRVDFYKEEEPLGTAGSLSLMSSDIDGTFILANCDTIMDVEFADVLEQHRSSGNLITIVASMMHVVLPYGVCHVRNGGLLDHIQEKPRYDLLASTGIYVLEPEALDALSSTGPTDAPDLISAALGKGQKVGVYPVPESAWLDVGQLEELQHALDRLGIH